ncbi:ATP-binding protein [Acidisphaera sp. S103]|uniref:ATP-binding protein n=1 Tax=Acidisphaera sp. S103 TaxID=1747223 RepID=UPI00131ADBBB|nr:ATP-binding protein [Acidisphaera sp. S103]
MSYVAAFMPNAHRSAVSQGQGQTFPRSDDTMDLAEIEEDGAGQDIDLRQLRHHTKNTLQRILGLIAEAPGLCDTPQGEKLAQELEYRICLSATISNALFGLTDTPGTMADRMRQLAGAVVDLMRAPDQVIRIGVFVRGCCPAGLREDVLRSAHELIGNAVKHGMRGRPQGRIAVRLATDEDCTTLTVLDNGWGFAGKPRSGEGLALTRDFAARHGGSLTMDGMEGTVATLELPH